MVKVVEPQAQKTQKLKQKRARREGDAAESGESPKVVKQRLMPFAQYRSLQERKFSAFRKLVLKHIKLDKLQVKRACQVLKNMPLKNQQDFLAVEDEFVYLEVTLGQVRDQFSFRPVQVELPHPIHGPQFSQAFCLFAAEPAAETKSLLAGLPQTHFQKVLGYDKFIKQYKLHKDRVQLLNNYSLFFCDWRIYNLLKDKTGKDFLERKKIPFPIDCLKVPDYLQQKFGEDLGAYFADLSKHSYFSAGNGPSYSLKVGRLSMEVRQLAMNVINGAANMIPQLLSEEVSWDEVRQISLKTSRSPSLPIYNYIKPDQKEAFLK